MSSPPIALILTVDDDGLVKLGHHPIGYGAQYIEPWQAIEQVAAELAEVLRERLCWPQTDPRYDTEGDR